MDLKGKAAQRIGIEFQKSEIRNTKSRKGTLSPRDFTSETILKILNLIKKLNADNSVTGIMVQMPLPENVRQETLRVVGAISAEKDVDGLGPNNLGLILLGKERFLPATVKAVLDILDEMQVDPAGKEVVIVGRSQIVGRPLAAALVNRDAVVTVAHSKTGNLAEVTRRGEVLISATGQAGLIKKDMVKPEAVVIDVGEPKADVDEEVREVASWLTPVPGGVGPVTVASLLENVVKAGEV